MEGILINYLAERYPKDLWKGARGRMSRQREAAAPCNAAIVRGFRCLWGAFWVVFRCVFGSYDREGLSKSLSGFLQLDNVFFFRQHLGRSCLFPLLLTASLSLLLLRLPLARFPSVLGLSGSVTRFCLFSIFSSTKLEVLLLNSRAAHPPVSCTPH